VVSQSLVLTMGRSLPLIPHRRRTNVAVAFVTPMSPTIKVGVLVFRIASTGHPANLWRTPVQQSRARRALWRNSWLVADHTQP